MIQVSKQSVLSYFNTLLKQFKLTSEQYIKIREAIYKAQYGCCQFTTVYWVPAATPAVYQIQFKDEDGNVVAETDVDGDSIQTIVIPEGLEVEICNNVITEVSSEGGFAISDSDGGVFSEADSVGEHCSGNLGLIAKVYIVTADPENPD